MPFSFHPSLRCPLDGLPLALEGGSLRCGKQHAFDVARQGYVNLLGVQDKRSRDPGDDRAMIGARHRFLQGGHYQPIADSIGELLLPYSKDGCLVVDAGCGEGYYLQQFREMLRQTAQLEPACVGFDISKWAVQVAARRFPATWMVASNRGIPLVDASADIILDLFGFPDFAEFARVLKPSGLLAQVRSGENHLRQLRELIYPEVKSRLGADAVPGQFDLVQARSLTYESASLEQAVLADLLLMTPHFFRASMEGRDRALALKELMVSVDVSIRLMRKA